MLPDELLEYLFVQSSISYKDLLNLSLCCKAFQRVSSSNTVWEVQLLKRWFLNKDPQPCSSNKHYFKQLFIVESKIKTTIKLVAEKSFNQHIVSNHLLRDELVGFLRCKWDFHLINTILKSLMRSSDLNLCYYTRKIIHYVTKQTLKRKWQEFVLEEPSSTDIILRGAILISKWCNCVKVLDTIDIEESINKIVKNVSKHLQSPVTSNTQMTMDEALHVVATINKVLYDEMKFSGNSNPYYDVNDSYIDQVIKRRKSISISLSVIYILIAEKFGLHLKGVNFLGGFLVKASALKNHELETFFVDVFRNGQVLTEDECLAQILPSFRDELTQNRTILRVVSAKEIIICLVRNLINANQKKWKMKELQTSLELMLMFSPDQEKSRIMLAGLLHAEQDIYVEEFSGRILHISGHLFPIDTSDAPELHAQERQEENSRKKSVKLRTHADNKNVEYKIGMIMKHRRFYYDCVIYGWDSVCAMSEGWKKQMGEFDFFSKDEQPFYNVLVGDGSSRYASQENIYPSIDPQPINHEEVGKYFHCLQGNRYIATSLLRECYPEDTY